MCCDSRATHGLPGDAPGAGHTRGSGAVGADLVDLVGLRRHIPGPVVDEAEVATLVEGAAQVGFPLGRVGFIHALGVLPCLPGPGLEQEERTADRPQGTGSTKTIPCTCHLGWAGQGVGAVAMSFGPQGLVSSW